MRNKTLALLLTALAACLVAAQAPAAVKPTAAAARVDGLRWQAEARWYHNRPAASYYTAAALAALGARLQAEADWYVNLPAASFYTPTALHALGARMQAEGHYYATIRPTSNGRRPVFVYGLLTAAALLALLGAGALLRLRRRSDASVPAGAASES